MTGHRVISDRGVVSKMAFDTAWASVSGVRLMLMTVDSPQLIRVAGSSKSNGGRWTTWLFTRTHHENTSNPEVPRWKRRTGDLGEVVSIGIHRGQSFTELRSIHDLTGFILLCWDLHFLQWYCIHLDDFHNLSCWGKCPSLGDLQAFLRFRVSISDQSYAGIIFSTPFLQQKKLELNL